MDTQSCITLYSTPTTREKCRRIRLQHEIVTYKQPTMWCMYSGSSVDAKRRVLMLRNVAYGCIRQKQEAFEHWHHQMILNHTLSLSLVLDLLLLFIVNTKTMNFCSFGFVSLVLDAIKIINERFYTLSKVFIGDISMKSWKAPVWNCIWLLFFF